MNKTPTRTATIHLDENDIIHVVIKEGIHMDYEDALDIYLVIKNLLGGKKNTYKLIDSRVSWSIDKKAKQFLQEKDIKDQTAGRAIVTDSVLNKLLQNFFISLGNSDINSKVFTDFDEAYDWLLEMKSS